MAWTQLDTDVSPWVPILFESVLSHRFLLLLLFLGNFKFTPTPISCRIKFIRWALKTADLRSRIGSVGSISIWWMRWKMYLNACPVFRYFRGKYKEKNNKKVQPWALLIIFTNQTEWEFNNVKMTLVRSQSRAQY